ncbi:TetR/AcrR family transcriptional regulator [Shewanella sp. C32]|uniref:TetR/AcrR family transcriptional regulator n=1 Tax=Shewanella electrica TaxID=515560 RepID=A0ABT2FIH1_9GAMM|nr:TetR/AcrR family transcriptional regulator [Shewanella electrica]MCH1924221.1 TetR/AcrR family transcriptional regulator [Shewanella electrica]MCS4556124.1 TetR/AcrR family transcriptional regulator [Shewanella electrica]
MQDGTKIKSGRGRPRAFDREQALLAAMRLFQTQGYSGTSLDDLANAMGIKRSSLNNTFGNKLALYQHTLALYEQRMGEQLTQRLFGGAELAESLNDYFSALIAIYCQEGGQGCFFTTTLPCVLRTEQTLQETFMANHTALESMFLARLQQAGHQDEQAEISAQLLLALQHTLSLRARAGVSQAALLKLSCAAIARILAA